MTNTYLNQKREERTQLVASVNGILDRAASEARDLSEHEDAEVSELTDRIAKLDNTIERFASQIEAEAKAADVAKKLDFGGTITRQGMNSEPQYNRNAPFSFFSDIAKAGKNDKGAIARLEQHRSERAADASSATDDLHPPTYLLDKTADIATFNRPVANLIGNAGTPTNDTLRIPRFTAGATVGWQSDENGSLTTYNRATDYVSADTDTVGAYYDVSWQSLQFNAANDQHIFNQLVGQIDEAVEEAVINRDATNFDGLLNVVGKQDVTYTDSPGVLTATDGNSVYAKILEADTLIAASRAQSAQAIVVSHAYWNWMLAQVDGNGRPLINALNPSNALGSNSGTGVDGARGFLGNFPVYVSNVPNVLAGATPDGNQAQVIVFRPSDCLLFESPVHFGTFDSVLSSTLGVRFRAHKMVAFTASVWPGSVAVITGTGINDGTSEN